MINLNAEEIKEILNNKVTIGNNLLRILNLKGYSKLGFCKVSGLNIQAINTILYNSEEITLTNREYIGLIEIAMDHLDINFKELIHVYVEVKEKIFEDIYIVDIYPKGIGPNVVSKYNGPYIDIALDIYNSFSNNEFVSKVELYKKTILHTKDL